MILTRVGDTGLFMSIMDMITIIPGLQGTGHLQGTGLQGTGHLQGTGLPAWDVLQVAGPREAGLLA